MPLFGKKTQTNYARRRAASEAAAQQDEEAKRALIRKMSRKGGAGRLSRSELNLAKRMGLGELQDED